MKRKVFCFLLAVLAIAIFSLGCGGGGGSHSNPASPSISSTARVSGVIVDSSKKPAENVDVRLSLVSNSGLNALPENFRATLRLATADTQTEFNTTTDKNGVYSFENVPYGRYSLSADAGTQGAYVANFVVAAEDTSVQEQTLTPFGFVSGTVITNNGKNDIQVYGAMVEACGIRAFTNNAGEFTLSHIPVGVKYDLVTTLQGYEATETASFTIPATAENLTYTLPKDIELKATVVNCYSVPATVTADLTSSQFPILVIAQDTKDEKNLFYNVLKEGDASCTLRITKASSYKLYAITSDSKKSEVKELAVEVADINQNKTYNSVVPLILVTSTPKTVVVKKIDSNVLNLDGGTVEYQKNTLNYYNGWISCLGNDGNMYCKNISQANNETEWKELSLDNTNYPTVICGNSVVSAGSDSTVSIASLVNGEEYREGAFCLDSQEATTINNLAFVPDYFISVGYEYNCSGVHNYLLKTYKPIDPSVVSDYSYERQSRDYSYKVNDEYLPPYSLKMAKGEDGNCYLAVLYSSANCFLKIYNVSDTNNNAEAIITDNNFGPDSFVCFQVLKDRNGNTLFYVEGTSDSGIPFLSCLYNNSGKISQSTTADLNGCYIDLNNNMYRYNSSSKEIIKTSFSSSVTDILDSSADSSKIIDKYKFEATTTGTTTNPNTDVDGIIGVEENADQVTIYAY